MTHAQNKPLSDAERAKAYRERKKKKTVTLTHISLARLDELVDFFQLEGHQQLFTELMELPLIRAMEAMQGWESNPDTSQLEKTTLSSEDKEVISTVKRLMWRGLCMGELPPQLSEALDHLNRPLYSKD